MLHYNISVFSGASGENVDDMFGNISDTEEQKQGQQKRSGKWKIII